MTHLQSDLFQKRSKPPKESSLHIQLVSILRWCVKPDVYWRHVPNGEYRPPRIAQKLKAMGVLPGSADLEFHWLDILCTFRRRVLHLELKTGNRPTSPSQRAFAEAMRSLGDEYVVARSIDEAIEVLGKHDLIRHDVEVCGRRW